MGILCIFNFLWETIHILKNYQSCRIKSVCAQSKYYSDLTWTCAKICNVQQIQNIKIKGYVIEWVEKFY